MAENRYQGIVERILRRGIDETTNQLTEPNDIAFAELVEDIRSWDVEHEHRTGTDGDRRTSEMLVNRLAKVDASPQIVEHTFDRRLPIECYVEVDADRIEGIPLFDGDVTQSVVTATLSDVSASEGIGVGVLAANGGDLGNREFLSFRVGSKHKALIGVSRNTKPGIAMLNADSYTKPFGVPVLLVDGAHEKRIREVVARRGSATLNVGFESERTVATNVEVTIRGLRQEFPPLVVMTPKSSWWTSTAERCGGIACWLACIRDLAAQQPKRTVLFTANTGHELGHIGLDHFLDQHPDLANGAHAWVHLGANFAAKGSNTRIQYSNEKLQVRLRRQLDKYQVAIAGEVDGSTRPGGEARNIFDAGGNYVSILGSNSLFHHPDDRMATNVDFVQAMRTRNAVVDLVRELSRS